MKRYTRLIVVLIWALSVLACANSANPEQTQPIPTMAASPFDLGRTMYGFFPSPPEVSMQSVLDLYRDMGDHADVVMLQREVPWGDFENESAGPSAQLQDVRNQVLLARQNGLETIFIVDALNGLNRREFYKLPFGWEKSFGNPRVRAAFKNYALRLLRDFNPRYLGLGSEINTYLDAHPEDAENFHSLYREVYEAIKAEAPETRVFVTFQWEDLNNLFGAANPGRSAGEINWDALEAFEPRLDLWVISSHPFVHFPQADQIPADYYTPLLQRTDKPLAVAEGGFTSRTVGGFTGRPEDQVDYLSAIHQQIGSRLDFWIYLLLNDFNLDSYAREMRRQGQGGDVTTLGLFASVGLREFNGAPKPALAVWDSFRAP